MCTHKFLGMTTDQVRAGYFHIRTRPAGQDPQSGPGLFTKRIFFPRPGPVPTRPCGLHGPHWAVVLQGPFCGPIKKNVCLILIFSVTKQEGKKNTKENPLFSQHPTDLNNWKPTKPIIFSATNRSETLLFSLQYFPTSKAKQELTYKP